MDDPPHQLIRPKRGLIRFHTQHFAGVAHLVDLSITFTSSRRVFLAVNGEALLGGTPHERRNPILSASLNVNVGVNNGMCIWNIVCLFVCGMPKGRENTQGDILWHLLDLGELLCYMRTFRVEWLELVWRTLR